MTTAKNANLIKVKRALAAKYDHLAQLTRSKPRRKHCRYNAERYRLQAQNLERIQ